ncbi:hypothetical protein FRC12_014775 [Ceratobasidium sp. 428]|nr:hypothetical protein FRC12_014775 [Ceratobasidium sp. 428]
MAAAPRTFILGAFSVLTFCIIFYFASSGSPLAAPASLGVPKDGRYIRRIVAVGDLHGDLRNMKKVLTMAGVINHAGDWSGNVDFFVQTGDIIDRGDDTLEMYALMEKLREQAGQAGGQVLSHLGNHEFMNAIGEWRDVSQSEIETFGSISERQMILSSGWIGRSWRANYTVATRLPLLQYFGPPNTDYDPRRSSGPFSHAAYAFLHGGLAPTYSNLTPYPSAINKLGNRLLRRLQDRKQPPPHPPNPRPRLPRNTTRAEIDLFGEDGPLWYRGWAGKPGSAVCPAAEGILAKTGVRRMIMGHTPNFKKIVSRCDGKIILIDTGISKAFGGVLSALSITYTLQPKPVSRLMSVVGAKAWEEREVIKAVYERKVDILVDSSREIRVGSDDSTDRANGLFGFLFRFFV